MTAQLTELVRELFKGIDNEFFVIPLNASLINNIDFIARDSGLIDWKNIFDGIIIKDFTQMTEIL